MDDNTYQRLNRTLLSIQNDITNQEEKEQQIGENNNNTDGSEHHTEDPYDILNLKALLKLFGPAFARRIDFWYSVFFAILFGTNHVYFELHLQHTHLFVTYQPLHLDA